MGQALQIDLFGQLKSSLVCSGVDEVGRGCIAGPVVACACFAEPGCHLPPVYDSKALTAKERDEIFLLLAELEGFHFGFGVVNSETIDQINILQATFKAMRLALSRLPLGFEEVLVDGSLVIPGWKGNQRAIIKGDAKEPLISAASIMAKVFRDEIMQKWAVQFPEYGFEIHKGYGTSAHLAAVEKHGPCPIHRRSFAPFSKQDADPYTLMLPFEETFI